LDVVTGLFGDISDCFSADVFFDDIVDVHYSSYYGDVYTMQTHNGIYIAGDADASFITKNCRCSMVYIEK
jgi:hypothetical protein